MAGNKLQGWHDSIILKYELKVCLITSSELIDIKGN